MIKNNIEYQKARRELKDIQNTLDTILRVPGLASDPQLKRKRADLEKKKRRLQSQMDLFDQNPPPERSNYSNPRMLIDKRKDLNFTQGHLAKLSGISRQTVSAYESNKYQSATFKNVRKIARALGLSIQLVEESEVSGEDGTPATVVSSNEWSTVMSLLAGHLVHDAARLARQLVDKGYCDPVDILPAAERFFAHAEFQTCLVLLDHLDSASEDPGFQQQSKLLSKKSEVAASLSLYVRKKNAETHDHLIRYLREVLGRLVEEFDASRGLLIRVEMERLTNDKVWYGAREPEYHPSYIETVLKTGKSILASTEHLCDGASAEVLVAPVKSKETMIGVVVLQSDSKHTFSISRLRDLETHVCRIAPACLILEQTERRSGQGMLWSHLGGERHWGIAPLIRGILYHFCDLVRDIYNLSITATVWDFCYDELGGDKHYLAVRATTGFDFEYIKKHTLPMHSFAGHTCLQANSKKVQRWQSGEEGFYDPVKADNQRVHSADGIAILDNQTPLYPGAPHCLCLYYFDEGKVPEDVIKVLATIIGDTIRVHEHLFPVVAREHVDARLRNLRNSAPRRTIDVLRQDLQDLFGASGSSVFAHYADSGELACVSSSGLTFPGSQEPVAITEAIYHTKDSRLQRKMKSITVNCFDQPGQPIVNNRHSGVGIENRFAEGYVDSESEERKFLGVGVPSPTNSSCEAPVGVLRLIRPDFSRPFKPVHRRCLEVLLPICGEVLQQWIFWYENRVRNREQIREEAKKHFNVDTGVSIDEQSSLSSYWRLREPANYFGSRPTRVRSVLKVLYDLLTLPGSRGCRVVLREQVATAEDEWFCQDYESYGTSPLQTELQTRDAYFNQSYQVSRHLDQSNRENWLTIQIPFKSWQNRESSSWVLGVDLEEDDFQGFDPILLLVALRKLGVLLGGISVPNYLPQKSEDLLKTILAQVVNDQNAKSACIHYYNFADKSTTVACSYRYISQLKPGTINPRVMFEPTCLDQINGHWVIPLFIGPLLTCVVELIGCQSGSEPNRSVIEALWLEFLGKFSIDQLSELFEFAHSNDEKFEILRGPYFPHKNQMFKASFSVSPNEIDQFHMAQL